MVIIMAKTLWNNIPCDHKVETTEDHISTTYVHSYDFGLMDFDEASHCFSGFSFEAQGVMQKIKEGFWKGSGFTGGHHDQFLFKAIREGDKVHVTMEQHNNVYKNIKSKMI